MKRPVILDVDTGVDDALAILMALRLPVLDVKAITTVSGNVHVDEVTENTKTVIGLAHPTNPPLVGRGSSVSLRRTRFHAPEVHGADGLGNVRRRYAEYALRTRVKRAVPMMLNMIKNSASPMTIIATGPLTNIARAIQHDGRTMRRVREIISMGGAFEYAGNTGPLAEFNYYVDPDAVEYVVRSGIPVTVVPLNVTETVPLMWEEVDRRCKGTRTPAIRFVRDILKFYMHYHNITESFHGGYMHDPLTVAIAAFPEIIKGKTTVPFLIETTGAYTSGTTLTRDARNREKHAPRVTVVSDIDTRLFWDVFYATVFNR